ncbi:MAG: hypothetical protein ACFCUN_01890 [Hyphomicrobiaceae bacterium]
MMPHNPSSQLQDQLRRVASADCPREGFRIVKAAIADLEKRGEQVPPELARARREMELACMIESQGR